MKEVNKKICADKNCSNEFTPFNTIQKYCSEKCLFKNKKPNLKLKPLYTPPKPKKCLECGEKFVPKNVSTEKVCGNYECRVEYALKIVEKNKVSKEKLEKRKRAEEKNLLKEKLKTISDWHNELQREVNTIVRLIDKNHPCISSQRSLGKSYDAGHLFGRQSNPHIRYHLFNIFAQSVHDNQWKSGNQLDFVDGIEKTFGTEIKEYCLSLKGLPSLKLSIDEIKEIIPKARQIVKHLKQDNKTYSIKERVELRKEYNEFLSIYK